MVSKEEYLGKNQKEEKFIRVYVFDTMKHIKRRRRDIEKRGGGILFSKHQWF